MMWFLKEGLYWRLVLCNESPVLLFLYHERCDNLEIMKGIGV